MCRSGVEGGRRCPGCGATAARLAHNERRTANRAQQREIVERAEADERVDESVVKVLRDSPPSVAKAWSAQRADHPGAGPEELSTPAGDSEVFTRRYDTVEEKLAAFHNELEQRIDSLGEDEHWQSYLHTMSRFHQYSMGNQLLIQAQRPGATLVAGFSRWKELGRHVNKGERQIAILAPRTIHCAIEDANGKPVIGEDGKPVKASKVLGFTTAGVFDVSQTDGQALPTPHAEISEEPPAGFRDDLEAAVRSSGYEVEYSDSITTDGATNPTTKKVTIASRLSPALQAATLAHELGHIRAGHLDRTAEYHTGHGGQRGQMEIEAESIAYAVCRANGMSRRLGDASGTYISGWAKAAGKAAVRESAQKVSSVVKEILGAGGWSNVQMMKTSAEKVARKTRRAPSSKRGSKR